MYITTLTAFVAILAIFALIVTRPDLRAGNVHPAQSCQATPCETDRTSREDQLPRLSRNHWERQDIARMLMTEDDYTGRITPSQRGPLKPQE